VLTGQTHCSKRPVQYRDLWRQVSQINLRRWESAIVQDVSQHDGRGNPSGKIHQSGSSGVVAGWRGTGDMPLVGY